MVAIWFFALALICGFTGMVLMRNYKEYADTQSDWAAFRTFWMGAVLVGILALLVRIIFQGV